MFPGLVQTLPADNLLELTIRSFDASIRLGGSLFKTGDRRNVSLFTKAEPTRMTFRSRRQIPECFSEGARGHRINRVS